MKALVTFLTLALLSSTAAGSELDADRDILVTFTNEGARVAANAGTPHRFRKRYAISADASRHARDVARDYGLEAVDNWPIGSLSVYCYVFRAPDADSRDSIVERLSRDARIESAQALQEFRTATVSPVAWNDTYAGMQHGLDQLNIGVAHTASTGTGVRVAVIDSAADSKHEDLAGRISSLRTFTGPGAPADYDHGTAVVSIIGANANNARGIVGVAPDAEIELLVACWHTRQGAEAVCDSFSLARALDALASRPPQVLNMSLTGPHDALLGRIIDRLHERGTIVIAAGHEADEKNAGFPASLATVIGVRMSENAGTRGVHPTSGVISDAAIRAPGRQVMVATPENSYDFRSGSSISAAHVSGVVALLLAVDDGLDGDRIRRVLLESQVHNDVSSVDACMALSLVRGGLQCAAAPRNTYLSELKPGTEHDTGSAASRSAE